jgi:iron(II)-dependent oxidoreductase
VLLPPEGNADNSTAHQEDGTNRIGPLMALYCYRYKATGDPAARERAIRTAHTMEKLERVTGVDGAIARSFNITDKPQRHEEWFFFPAEWHWSPLYENTRWLGDPSSDSFTRFLYGNAIYFDLVADATEKERVRALVDRVLTRFVDHNFKIVDEDGKKTLWGHYSPEIPHQRLNSLLCLAAMKIGSHITGNPRYDDAYKNLIHEHDYHEHTLYADLPMNLEEGVHWDHDLGMLGLYHLLKYEDDPWLLGFYRNSLNRFHAYDMTRPVKDPFYEFLYKVGIGDSSPVGPDVIEGFMEWKGAWRGHRSESLRQTGGPVLVEGIWQECGEKFPRMYWMGRYYGFIDENSGPDQPMKKPATVPATEDKTPAGMVYVPTGEFTMGSEVGDNDERPERRVKVDAFYIDRYEVSNTDFKKFKPEHEFKSGEENHAVSDITWEEADAYAKWAGKRLPTETEWEKAARGADARMFPWGDTWVPGIVLPYDRGPVDGLPYGASPYGCEQMAGNVWEWVDDWYKPYPGNEVESPAYGEKFKVIRGGADFNGVTDYRTTARFYVDPKSRIHGYAIGFRCAMDAE